MTQQFDDAEGYTDYHQPSQQAVQELYGALAAGLGLVNHQNAARNPANMPLRPLQRSDGSVAGFLVGNRHWKEGIFDHVQKDLDELHIPYMRGTIDTLFNGFTDQQAQSNLSMRLSDEGITIPLEALDIESAIHGLSQLAMERNVISEYLRRESGLPEDYPFLYTIAPPNGAERWQINTQPLYVQNVANAVGRVSMMADIDDLGFHIAFTADQLTEQAKLEWQQLPLEQQRAIEPTYRNLPEIRDRVCDTVNRSLGLLFDASAKQAVFPGWGRVFIMRYEGDDPGAWQADTIRSLRELTQYPRLHSLSLGEGRELLAGIEDPARTIVLPASGLVPFALDLADAVTRRNKPDLSGFEVQYYMMEDNVAIRTFRRQTEDGLTAVAFNSRDLFGDNPSSAERFAAYLSHIAGVQATTGEGPDGETAVFIQRKNGCPIEPESLDRWMAYAITFTQPGEAAERERTRMERQMYNGRSAMAC